MTYRREMLAFLGVGSMTALAGCFDTGTEGGDTGGNGDGGGPPSGPTGTEGPTNAAGEPSNYERARRMQPDRDAWIEVGGPGYDFDYGERKFPDPPGDFERVVGEGFPDQEGDRLLVAAGDLAPGELAARLRIAWRVTGGDLAVEERVDGSRVRFVGGRRFEYWHVAGSHEGRGVVLAVRAASESSVRELAREDWSL